MSQHPAFPAGARLAGRYVVVRHLGAGGIGSTWLVRDLLTDQLVALKLLHHRTTEALAALRREFSLLRGLVHPCLARVHDFGSITVAASPAPFYTSDFIDGTTLAASVSEMTPQQCVSVLIDALRGLAHLHRAGIRHGDFTPSNILVAKDGRGTLIDLSCAVPLGAPPAQSVSGTPGYLAPEVTEGRAVDARADIYAVGVTLQHVASHATKELSPAIARLARRCTRPAPQDRPPTVHHVLEALGAPAYAPHALYLPPSQLVGRDQPWASMRSALDDLLARTSGPRCIGVFGAAGVGKSRLLQELKWESQLRCLVIEGNPRAAQPVQDMVARALGRDSIEPGLKPLLAACDALARMDSATVLLIDDAHLLTEPDRQALLALTRTLPSDGPALLAFSSNDAWESLPDTSLSVVLQPLDAASVAAWAGPAVPRRLLPRLLEWTGGFPAALVSLLSRMSAEALDLRDLSLSPGIDPWAQGREKRLRNLSPAQRRALATMTVLDEPLAHHPASSRLVDPDVLSALTASGMLKSDDRGFRLARAVEAPEIRRALRQAEIRQAHERVAEWLQSQVAEGAEDVQATRLAPRLVEHLARSGAPDRAADWLPHDDRQVAQAPGAWRHAALSLAETTTDRAVQARCAEVLITAGWPDRALAVLDMLSADGVEACEGVRLARAAAHLAQGQADLALSVLASIDHAVAEESMAVRVAILRSRALIQMGDYAAAMRTAAAAFRDDLAPTLRGELHDAMGVAASYLGPSGEAYRHLRTAASLHQQTGRVDALMRTLSYQAFVAYRAGDTGAAERAYRETRAEIERHGFTDKLANAELNVGAACHQRGNWGEALGCYERGLQIAEALAQRSHEVQARFNLAKLYADIGAPDLAEPMIERGRQLADGSGLRFFSSAFVALRAETAALREQWAQARKLFEQASAEFAAAGAQREALEVGLQALEAMLACGEIDDAVRALERLDSLGSAPDAPDLTASQLVARANVRLAQGNASEAIAALEEALEHARRADQPSSRADLHRLFARVWEHQRAPALANKEASLAREIDERIAASLSEPLREAFWKHPKRRAWAPSPPSHHTAPALADKVRRVLDINAKLNSSLRTRDVLSRTMDAAVELVGAERGFLVLLAAPDDFEGAMSVPVARNLDREQVGKSHLKFSRTIAEQCMRTGEPIVTTDAQVDGRFSTNVSVHAMRLKSVVCVPIRSPAGTLGALYLDNRFQRGSFDAEDIELLSAFGNQAAIALTNARLHDELRRRTRELEQERARVQELMASQAAEIDRLTDEVRTTRQVLGHRYDYSNIIGRSRGMQQVFAMLDRVIESDIPVLILGESGTGKELIARALHVHGRRRERPFVAINCAAVPHALLESELFGHVKGAFTGADRDHDGLFVSARGGTVLLDEIGDMPLEMQAKLLRVLQEGEVRAIGATRPRKVDFRLACATHRDLTAEVDAGRFRQDLFYRINVVPIRLPPLRDRREDIPELAHHFIVQHAQRLGRIVPRLERDALQVLLRHRWPGNVRELENLLLQAVLLCESDRIRAIDVQVTTRTTAQPARIRSRRDYREAEQETIRDALVASRWNVSRVARELGMSRPTLYRKMRQYGIHEQ